MCDCCSFIPTSFALSLKAALIHPHLRLSLSISITPFPLPLVLSISLSLTQFCSFASPQPFLPVLCNSLASLLVPSVMTMKGTMPAAQPKPRSCHSVHWTEHTGICVVETNDVHTTVTHIHTNSQALVVSCICIHRNALFQHVCLVKEQQHRPPRVNVQV